LNNNYSNSSYIICINVVNAINAINAINGTGPCFTEREVKS